MLPSLNLSLHKVQEEQPDSKRQRIDVVSEYDTYTWPEEFQLDLQRLKYDLNLNLPNTYEDHMYQKLSKARTSEVMIEPAQDSKRQTYVNEMRTIKPFNLDMHDFVEAIKEIAKSTNGHYFCYAMPVDPVQQQYKKCSSLHQACGIVTGVQPTSSESHVAAFLTSGFIKTDSDVVNNIEQTVNHIESSTCYDEHSGTGTYNKGKPVEPSEYHALHENDLFKYCDSVFTKDGDSTKDVHSIMASKTGLWFRIEKKSSEKLNDDKTKQMEDERLIEMYYSLWSSLLGTSLPLYWISSGKNNEFRKSLSEQALRDMRSTPIEVRVSGNKNVYKDMIARRFSACMLRIAELKMLLIDNKPHNMLIQRNYDDTNPCIVADVVVTDLDPFFTIFVNALPERAMTCHSSSSSSSNTDECTVNVDSECVRFVNYMIFSISASCYSVVAKRQVLHFASIYLNRYAFHSNEAWKGVRLLPTFKLFLLRTVFFTHCTCFSLCVTAGFSLCKVFHAKIYGKV